MQRVYEWGKVSKRIITQTMNNTFQSSLSLWIVHPCTGYILDCRTSSPMLFEAPQEQEEHARVLVLFQMKSTVDLIGILYIKSDIIRPIEKKPTYTKDVACINHSQPVSLCQLEYRPWYVFNEVIVMVNRGNRTI